MPATYDVTTDRGKVRLYIGDTTVATAQFADDEIDAFIAATTSLYSAAALALRAWAAAVSRDEKQVKLGAWSATYDKAGAMLELADTYDARAVATKAPAQIWAQAKVDWIPVTEAEREGVEEQL